ncbi:MAG TPA: hypothetical protein VH540_23075 [Ktedonobacterales bacterium]|jgi:hypothetical protein
MLKRCAEWSVLLAANQEHLTPDERRALANHLATCRACRRAQADFALQDAFLRRPSAPLAGLPPRILAAWAEEDAGALPGRDAGATPQSRGTASSTLLPGRPARQRSLRVYKALSGLAAVLVVALLVSALVMSHLPTASHPTGQGTQVPGTQVPGTATPTAQAATPTATPSATPAPKGGWVIPPGLANLKSEPMLAPSNPNIIYQVVSSDGQTTAPIIKRSDDGGATWRSRQAPFVASGQIFGAALAVSPFDAQVLVLQVAYYASVSMPTACPDTSAAARVEAARAGFALCYLHYLSRDGGSHWQGLALPVSDQEAVITVLEPIGTLTASGGPLLVAQGTRLYAYMDNPGGQHLLLSADGGQTWRVDDQGVLAAGRSLCGALALPAPDGAVVFAIANTLPCGSGGTQELWRSDDAGANWHRAGPLPGPAAVNVQSFVVSRQGSGAMPLIYLFQPIGLVAPSAVKVSTDGGATWVLAPDEGMQAGVYTFFGPLAVLGDGSVLAGVQTPTSTQPYLAMSLYRWKPGEDAWHEVTPGVVGAPVYVLVTGQPETIWMVTSDGQGGYTAQRVGTP